MQSHWRNGRIILGAFAFLVLGGAVSAEEVEWPSVEELLQIATRKSALTEGAVNNFFGRSLSDLTTVVSEGRRMGNDGAIGSGYSRVSRRIVEGGYLVETNAAKLPRPDAESRLVEVEVTWHEKRVNHETFRRVRLIWDQGEWSLWMKAEGEILESERISDTIYWVYRNFAYNESGKPDPNLPSVLWLVHESLRPDGFPIRTWIEREADKTVRFGSHSYGGGGPSGPPGFSDSFYKMAPPYYGPKPED